MVVFCFGTQSVVPSAAAASFFLEAPDCFAISVVAVPAVTDVFVTCDVSHTEWANLKEEERYQKHKYDATIGKHKFGQNLDDKLIWVVHLLLTSEHDVAW